MKQQLIDWLRRPENANKSVEQIVQHIESIDPWIKASLSMPDSFQHVIVRHGNEISIAAYNSNVHRWELLDAYYEHSLNVTHWQPLPEKSKQ